MENILSNLCPEVPTIQNPALISSLVTSIGQIRYKHKGTYIFTRLIYYFQVASYHI